MNRNGLAVTLWLVAGSIAAALLAPPAHAQNKAASLQGSWRSADSVIKITMSKNEIKAQFAEVGQGAKALGFKPGDVSFTGATRDQLIVGEQVIRYGTAMTCGKDGRKVPMMGKLAPDGQVLALHFYNLVVDKDCKDTGQYGITETLWQRVGR